MMLGRVKWFNREEGYGFMETETHDHVCIQCDMMKDGCYFHDLEENEKVAVLEICETSKGPLAVRLRRMKGRA